MPWIIAAVLAVAIGGGIWWLRRRLRGEALSSPAIDPFTVGERWRRHVTAAQSSLRRYREIVADTPPGPLHDRLAEITRQVERGVGECWQIAKRGDELDKAADRLNSPRLRAELERASDETTKASLQSQLDSAARIRTTRDVADQRLKLLNTRLGELLAQAAEVSVGSDTSAELGSAVDDVVTQLQALRQAVEDVDAVGRPAPLPAELTGEAAPAPPPAAAPAPPPAPAPSPEEGPGQASPST